VPDIPASATDIDEPLIRIEAASFLTGRHVEQIRKWVRKGKIIGVRLTPTSRRVLIPFSQVEVIKAMPERKPITMQKVVLTWADGRTQTIRIPVTGPR
jgi:hypothetical protein